MTDSVLSVARLGRRALTRAMQVTGATRWVARSPWRRNRLLILCYHGISLDDEHLWRPGLFMPPTLFRERMEILARGGYAVVPLGDGIERLYGGDLPARAVALTFDDGFHDFHELAVPILREFGFPATVYLRTDYCGVRAPVFNIMASYILWKAAPMSKDVEVGPGETVLIDTRSSENRDRALDVLLAHTKGRGLEEKQQLLEALAQLLGIDLDRLLELRLLQIMQRDQVASLEAAGVDVGLHTHTHRSPEDESLYRQEIVNNRDAIRDITGKKAGHFCYPSGVYSRDFMTWLAAEGVVSATTTVAGLAHRGSDPLLLPRFVDTTPRTGAEFEAWTSGFGEWIARTHHF